MDEKAIDAKGAAPIQPELDRIAAIRDLAGLASEVARLQSTGSNVLFDFGSGPDFKDSSMDIAQVDQGGLGLPDRDYYLKTDPKSVTLRAQYVAHLRRMFQLLGNSQPAAAKKADVVMRIETALAKGSLDRVARRDPTAVYHKLALRELSALSPSFAWPKYLQDVHAPSIGSLNVAVPDFFKQLQTLLSQTSLDDWKTYLAWHLVHADAHLLSAPFVNANFDFYGKTLTGTKELRPRWKRCVSMVDGQLGEALGQSYVNLTFGADGKLRTLKEVQLIEAALGRDISGLAWMTPETKKLALEKLHAVVNKIGYPDKWRDYSAVKIVRGDAVGDSDRADQFEFQRQVAKIGKPVDRGEWDMTPPTVNADYDPTMNTVNFPAGILQHSFFDKRMDDAVNFGAIGAVIGHEAHARLRRRRPPVRCQRQPARLVDPARRQGIRAARRVLRESIRLLHGGGRRQAEREADLGREHRRQWRTPPCLHGADGSAGGRAAGQDRRLHSRAAPVPGLWTDLVLEAHRRGRADARHGRPAFARQDPREWRGFQHAGVPEGIRLQSRSAHGPAQGMPGLVNPICKDSD